MIHEERRLVRIRLKNYASSAPHTRIKQTHAHWLCGLCDLLLLITADSVHLLLFIYGRTESQLV